MQKNKRSQKELITGFNDHTKLIRTITSGDDVGDKIKITESTSLTLTTKSSKNVTADDNIDDADGDKPLCR